MIDSNKKYLIALDLDGTLLNDEKTISPLNKKVLTYLENLGHVIVLCSGRALRSVTFYHESLGLKKSPVISYNGHLITNSHDSKFPTASYLLNKNTVISIYKELNENDLITCGMSESLITIYCDDPEDYFLFAFYDTKDMTVKQGLLNENINEDVYTCVFRYDENAGKQEQIQKVVDKHNDVNVRFRYGGNYCELYIKDVSKARAICHVASYYGVNQDNIITFGDSDNDKEMLRDFKHSYLMKNGNPTLKEYAHNITAYTNSDDGVAIELIKFFNLEI